jgi:hypothetical protein
VLGVLAVFRLFGHLVSGVFVMGLMSSMFFVPFVLAVILVLGVLAVLWLFGHLVFRVFFMGLTSSMLIVPFMLAVTVIQVFVFHLCLISYRFLFTV